MAFRLGDKLYKVDPVPNGGTMLTATAVLNANAIPLLKTFFFIIKFIFLLLYCNFKDINLHI